jgi:hypothetical protein
MNVQGGRIPVVRGLSEAVLERVLKEYNLSQVLDRDLSSPIFLKINS